NVAEEKVDAHSVAAPAGRVGGGGGFCRARDRVLAVARASAAGRAPSVCGPPDGRRQAESERHLAGARYGPLGPRSALGSGRRARRAERRGGRRPSVPALGPGKEERELPEARDGRSAVEVLSARRATCDLRTASL